MKLSLKSFGRQEPKKHGNVLLIAFTILTLCILSLLKARYCLLPYGKSHIGLKLEATKIEPNENETSLLEDEDEEPIIGKNVTNPTCYDSSARSITCDARGDLRVQCATSTINVDPWSAKEEIEIKIKPYARNDNAFARDYTKEWSLKPFTDAEKIPQCTKNHTAPAVLFSIGGFTGNVFHDFTDVIIPLFAASRRFGGEVHFLVSDTKTWWLGKYRDVLKHLSHYEVVDTESDTGVHCFSKAIVGLKFYKELGIDAKRMSDFKGMLKSAFGLEKAVATAGSTNTLAEGGLKRPRLLIISRKKSRAFVNERGMVSMATSLGFDVRVAEADLGTDVAKFARLVNSADVMIGVHGAGLTNMVFLPFGAVVIQVIPLGRLEYIARDSFKEPAEEMGVKYMEYVIGEEESTLIDQYPRDHAVIKDPASVHTQGWLALREVYLDNQNVRPHLGKLRDTLLDALNLLPKN